MEYFDFEDAAGSRSDLPDFASDIVEANQDDHNEMVESLYFDKSFSLPTDPAPIRPPGLVLPDSTSTDHSGVKDDDAFNPDDNTNGVYPLYRPKEPCERCRQMGLECFLAHSGTFVNGCTICVSLYRECSFTHKKPPGVYMDTLATLTEDTQELVGGLTGRKTMRSLTYNTSTLDHVDRPRKAGARFGREPTKILKTWLAEHARHPYPTESEKDELKRHTGLKRSQISNWLANARRRGKVPQVSDTSSPVLGAVDIPQSNRKQTDLSELTPFQRWKISPPEHEAASATAIVNAIRSTALDSPTSKSSSHAFASSSRQASTRRTSSNDDSTNFSMFQAPSISSFGTARSSMSKSESASHLSVGTTSSMNSAKDRRRRRRNPLATRPPPQKPRGARIFQCTFCTDSFPSKYDWQRHEKSLHLALERWSCAPQGGTILLDNRRASGGNAHPQQARVCVFCQCPNPSDEHLESAHSFLTCQDKTLQERTFYRKDHLRQHLRLLHDATFHPGIMDSWKSTTSEVQSRCGFCPQVFNTWAQRADHLAAHFRNGSDMKDWKGGWGFEPFVERLVENAMPPYMIGQERSTMDPYVAKGGNVESRRASLSSSVHQTHVREGSALSEMLDYRQGRPEMGAPNGRIANVQGGSNCWLRIQRRLKAYISDCLSKGLVPTDQDLQRQARLTVFNDDDPWNQTCADNPVWLGILKRDCGLSGEDNSAPLAQGNGELEAIVGKPVSHMTLEELPMNPPYAVRGGLRGQSQLQRQTQMSRSPYPQSSTSSTSIGFPQRQDLMPTTSSAVGGWEGSTSLPGDPLFSASIDTLAMAAHDDDAMDFDFDIGDLGINEASNTWQPDMSVLGGVGVAASGTSSGGLYTGDFGYGMTSAGSGGFGVTATTMGEQGGYGGGSWYSGAG